MRAFSLTRRSLKVLVVVTLSVFTGLGSVNAAALGPQSLGWLAVTAQVGNQKKQEDPKKQTEPPTKGSDQKVPPQKSSGNGNGNGGEQKKLGEDTPPAMKPNDNRVGPNAPVDPTPKYIFRTGPFEGMELFGYSYFSSARALVEYRRRLLTEPLKELAVKPNPVEATQGVVDPAVTGFVNVQTPAPDRYLLGPGDKLKLRISSPTRAAENVVIQVDTRGYVVVPGVSKPILVRGQNLVAAEKAIARELGRVIRDAEVIVTLDELRTISISVVGEVVAQGNYQVPSVMTLFNALYLAGGPTPLGSMRRIELRRANAAPKTIDLYGLLLRGDSSQDVPLMPGDLILVPTAGNRVAMKGEVRRPAVYETLPTERLDDALGYAGGAEPSAILDRVQVESYDPGKEKILLNVDLTARAAKSSPFVRSNDVVTFFPVRDTLLNAVSVTGSVDQPREYPFESKMTVADLITKARGLMKDAYIERADLYRLNDDLTETLLRVDLKKALERDPDANLPLKPRDRLVVYSLRTAQFIGERRVEIIGAVQRPGTYNRVDGLRLADLVLQAGGLLPEAFGEYAFIRRRNDDGSEGPLIRVSLIGAIKGNAQDNVLLTDRDRVTVFRADETQYRPEQSVTIVGAVQRPGTYPRSSNLTIKDLIDLAGGLLPNAANALEYAKPLKKENEASSKIEIADVITSRNNPVLADGDVVSVLADSDILLKPILVSISGRVKQPGVYAIRRKGERISDLVKRAGGLMTDAWSEGAQFTRDPDRLSTDAQIRLTPRVQEILKTVQSQEYIRALAKSDIDKIRVLQKSGQSGLPNIGLTGAMMPQTGAAAGPDLSDSTLLKRETVTPARELSANELETFGNVPLRVDQALKNEKVRDNIELQDGDILYIPERPNTVSIKGAVILPSNVLFVPGRDLRYYTDRSGGYTQDADQREVLVIRATGTIIKGRPSTRIELGDTIFVPTKVMVARLTESKSTFEEIFNTVLNTGLFIAIIRSLTR